MIMRYAADGSLIDGRVVDDEWLNPDVYTLRLARGPTLAVLDKETVMWLAHDMLAACVETYPEAEMARRWLGEWVAVRDEAELARLAQEDGS